MKYFCAIFTMVCLFTQKNKAQISSESDKNKNQFLQINLDGVGDWEDYIKVRVWYVDYVRDRLLADLQIQVITQTTAAGGTLYTVYFIGYRQLAGKADTLHYTASVENTNKKTRDDVAHLIELGLMPFIAENGQQDLVSISYLNQEQVLLPAVDKFNFWVYSVQLNGNITGDQTTDLFNGNGQITAARITDQWKEKIIAGLTGSNNQFQTSTFTYVGNTIIKNINLLFVYSIDDHWSLGFEPAFYSSTFSNIQSQFNFAPGIEYNAFRYHESVNHLLTIKYRIQPLFNHYISETIYNQSSEFLLNNLLDLTFTQIKPWGNLSSTFTASDYLNHPKAYRLDFEGSMNFKIAKGLFFNISGNTSLINNQLSIAKLALTPEEILLQQKETLTNYSYGVLLGITYTFGARFNNIVNPRYEGGVTIDPELINVESAVEGPD